MDSSEPTTPSDVKRQYAHGEPRPLGGYVVLMATYAVTSAALFAVARERADGRVRLGWSDIAGIAVATHRLSRTLAKDSVTSPLRAPLTRYEGPGMPSEVNEGVARWARDRPIGHAVSELVTCPFCLGQWVATALVFLHVVFPNVARLSTAVLVATAGADALQYIYAGLQRLEPGGDGDGGEGGATGS